MSGHVTTTKRVAGAYPAVVLLLFLGPLYGYSLVTIGEQAVGRPDLLATALVLTVAVVSAARSRQLLIDRAGLYYLSFAAISSISMLLALLIDGRSPFDMLTLHLQVLVMVILYVGSINFHFSMVEWVHILRLWILSAVGIALFGVYQGIARMYSLPLARLAFNGGAGTLQRVGYDSLYHPVLRVGSVFLEPSWYGTYLVPPALLCLASIFIRDKSTPFGTRINVLLGGLLVFSILQSASLLSYVTLGAGVGFLFLLSLTRHGLRRIHGAVLLAGVCLLPILIISQSFRSLTVQLVTLPLQIALWLATGDIGHVTAASAQVRLKAVLATVQLWGSGQYYQLLVGFGPNSLEGSTSVTFGASSGSYFQILLDQGALGLAAFLGGLTTLIIKSCSLRRGREFNDYLSLAVPAILFATGVMLLQIGYLRPIRWFPILFAGGLLSVGESARKTE